MSEKAKFRSSGAQVRESTSLHNASPGAKNRSDAVARPSNPSARKGCYLGILGKKLGFSVFLGLAGLCPGFGLMAVPPESLGKLP